MKCLNIDAASETESEVRIDYEENYIMNFITKRSKKMKPITSKVVTDFSSTKKNWSSRIWNQTCLSGHMFVTNVKAFIGNNTNE